MKLEAATTVAPRGLEVLLVDLGDGEAGFGGTPVHGGAVKLAEYLRQCCEMRDPAKVQAGLVPQTVYWALNDAGEAVGMVRMRHYLNDKLRIRGGHIGYYVRKDQRGKGYGKEMLRLALRELRQLGERRALLTTDPANARSIGVISANGGRLEDISTDPETGLRWCRYWIELDAQG